MLLFLVVGFNPNPFRTARSAALGNEVLVECFVSSPLGWEEGMEPWEYMLRTNSEALKSWEQNWVCNASMTCAKGSGLLLGGRYP